MPIKRGMRKIGMVDKFFMPPIKIAVIYEIIAKAIRNPFFLFIYDILSGMFEESSSISVNLFMEYYAIGNEGGAYHISNNILSENIRKEKVIIDAPTIEVKTVEITGFVEKF